MKYIVTALGGGCLFSQIFDNKEEAIEKVTQIKRSRIWTVVYLSQTMDY